MADSDTERLVVLLEARVSDFERQLKRANKAAKDNFTDMTRSGQVAGQQLSASMSNSVAGSIAKYTSIGAAVVNSFGAAQKAAQNNAKTIAASVLTVGQSFDKVSSMFASMDKVIADQKMGEAIAEEQKKLAELTAEYKKMQDARDIDEAVGESPEKLSARQAALNAQAQEIRFVKDKIVELERIQTESDKKRQKSSKETADALTKDAHGSGRVLTDQLQTMASTESNIHIALVRMIPPWMLWTASFAALAVGAGIAADKLGKIASSMDELGTSSGISLDKLFKLRAGLGSEELDKFGSTINGITDNLNKMLANPLEVSDFSRGLRALGVQFKQNSDRAEVMLQIFTKIGQIGDPVKQAAYAKLFGINDTQLSMIRSGDFKKAYDQSQVDAKNLQALGEEWRRTGKIIDDIFVQMWNSFSGSSAKNMAEALKQFNDNLDHYGHGLADIISTVTDAISAAAAKLAHPLDTIKGLYDDYIHLGDSLEERAAREKAAEKKEPLKVTVTPKKTTGTLNPPWPGAQQAPATSYQKALEALLKLNDETRLQHDLSSADNVTLQYELKLRELKNALIEDEVEKMRRAGASEQAILEARQKGIPIDEKKLEQGKRLLEVYKQQTDQLPQLADALRDINNPMKQLDQIMTSMVDDMSGGFADIITGAKSASDAFRDMGQSILRMIAQIVMKQLLLNSLSFLGLPIAGKAIGGPVEAGTPYVVGEKGSELFVPKVPGTIVPADKTKAIMNQIHSPAAGAGGQTINVNNNVTVNASGGTPAQNADLAKQVTKSIEQSTRQIVADEMRRQSRPGGLLRRGR